MHLRTTSTSIRISALAACAFAIAHLSAADPYDRDAFMQPFASDSIWNTPIGSGARYVSANMPAVPGGNANTWVGMPWADEERIVLKPTAPSTAIYQSKGWTAADRPIVSGGVLANVPMPSSYVVPAGPGNDCASFLLGDGRTILQMQPLYRGSAGASGTALLTFPRVDLYGAGISGSHGGSRMSGIGGCIRSGELRPGQQGPKHALKVAVYAKQVLYRCTTASDGYRWPATTADSYAVGFYGTIGNNTNVAMKMGALLAIPPSVVIANMGLETEPARQLAWTLQNYGAYIVDDTYAPSFTIDVDEGADGSFRGQFKNDYGIDFNQTVASDIGWSRDCQRLHQALQVVDNNGPSTIGGGGTPRVPLAQPLADPAFPVPGSLTASGAADAVRVAWSDPSTSETGFELQRRASTGTWAPAAMIAANGTSWTDAAASAGTTWQYRLRLRIGATASAWSATASCTPTGSVNTAPTISAIAAQGTDEDTAKTVSFTIGDAQTAPGSLVVGVTASNAALVAAAGMSLGGSGASRTLSIAPLPNAGGSTTITLTVRDAGGLSASSSFALTVTPVNDRPTISAITDRALGVGQSTGTIPLTIGDAETAAASLAVTAASSNAALVPASGVALGGSGANRTVTVTPAAGRAGTATITLTVTDGALSATSAFTVSVNALPAGWTGADIGSTTPAGSASGDGDSFTVSGAGYDIWNSSDAFHFAYLPLTGDGDVVVEVVSQSYADDWSKAGLMIRESLAPGSRHVSVFATPASGAAMQYRSSPGGASFHVAGPFVHAPTWLKLSRRGTSFSGHQSSDGVTWKLISTRTVAMGATALVGLAVTSHHDGTLSTATFSGFQLLPVNAN